MVQIMLYLPDNFNELSYPGACMNFPGISGFDSCSAIPAGHHADHPHRMTVNRTKPNLVLQSLTTREPDSSMLEVAIESFKTMRKAEQDFAV
jgi:hypothetical protein